jgi:glycine/D-amino acid oxidase-like deaminating enzyme
MDLVSDRPLWPILDGLPHAYPRLNDDARAEVVVIGGGVTGALVAHALIGAGLETMVIDRREIGWGSTGASTALLQYELDVPLVELRESIGRDDADRTVLACRDAIERLASLAPTLGDDIGFRRRDSLYLVARKRDLKAQRAELAARREIGLGVEWLERDDLVQRFGIDRPGAILSAGAAEVDAYALAHALLADGVRRGLRVFSHTTVEKITPGDEGVSLRLAGGATVIARHVVFATGYETPQLTGFSAAKLISTFAIASDPGTVPSPWKERGAVIWERAHPYLYLRSTADGRIIIGGEDEDFRDPAHRDALVARKAARLARRYGELFDTDPLDIAFAWAGTFGETREGLPRIGPHDDWPHCHFALGYGGNGIVFSVLAAEIIRDALNGHPHPLSTALRFRR